MKRLNKFLSESGLASRRVVNKWISDGLIKVNNKIIKESGYKIDVKNDKITFKNKNIQLKNKYVYYIFNKPKKVVTTLKDPKERPTVANYIKYYKLNTHIFPVGRLDWNTEGLLILTDDGGFSQKISHPKYKIKKTYLAKLDKTPTQNQLEKLKKGVSILSGRVKASSVFLLKTNQKKPWVKITISEGKNHQIKHMFRKINCDVLKLKRISIGKLYLGKLKIGAIKKLTSKDKAKIFL